MVSQLAPADFADNPQAFFAFAPTLAPEVAIPALLEMYPRAGAEPSGWLDSLRRLGTDHTDLAGRVVQVLVRHPFDDLARNLVVEMLSWDALSEDSRRRLEEWVYESAGPGDASLLAQAFSRQARPGACSRDVRLATWLVRNGSAHLRAADAWEHAAAVLATLMKHGDGALQEAAIHIVLSNHDGFADRVYQTRAVLSGLNAALEADIASAAIAEWLRALPPNICTGLAMYFATNEGLAESALRNLFALVLLEGRIPRSAQQTAFACVLGHAIPSGATPPSFDLALAGLQAAANLPSPQFPQPIEPAWVRFLSRAAVSAILRSPNHEILRKRIEETSPWFNERWARELSEGLGDALVDDDRPGALLASRILSQGDTIHHLLAGIRALLTVQCQPVGTSPNLGPQVKQVERLLLHHPWTTSCGGIDPRKLFRGIRQFESASVKDSSLREEGDVLQLDAEAFEMACAGGGDLVRVACWLVHELIHLREQALGPKSNVPKMRSTGVGGESNLLHVDLGADHATAGIVAAALELDVLVVKNHQGRSLAAYPAGRHHSTPGSFRKAQRLVSLRADLAWRQSGRPVGPDEYVFADFGPTEGSFVLFRSGPPFTMLRVSSLTAADAKSLRTSVAPSGAAPIEDIDTILRRLLAD